MMYCFVEDSDEFFCSILSKCVLGSFSLLTLLLTSQTEAKLQEVKLDDKDDLIDFVGSSIINVFRNGEDNYPLAQPASGFSQTPHKSQRNKGGW
jgi:hypothetical protein